MKKALMLALTIFVVGAVAVSCYQTMAQPDAQTSATQQTQTENGPEQTGSAPGQPESEQGMADRYAQAIQAHGGEMAQHNPVITQSGQEDGSDMMLESMGLNTEDMEAFALSTTMMNVKAYGIAAIMPAQGREQAVMDALRSFIDRKCAEFETYLADQHEVAKNARLEMLADGTVLLVMTEDQDTVFQAIAEAIVG